MKQIFLVYKFMNGMYAGVWCELSHGDRECQLIECFQCVIVKIKTTLEEADDISNDYVNSLFNKALEAYKKWLSYRTDTSVLQEKYSIFLGNFKKKKEICERKIPSQLDLNP